MNTDTWNVDGEQYRVIILGELVATFTDVEAAADEYTAHACIRCWTHANRLPIGTYSDRTLCCDVQTWRREDCPTAAGIAGDDKP